MNICKDCKDEIEDRFFNKKKQLCIHCEENRDYDIRHKYDCNFVKAGLTESQMWE